MFLLTVVERGTDGGEHQQSARMNIGNYSNIILKGNC